jgi:tyrosyl-tRNA synthetase
MIHGETALSEAQRASEILFGGELEGVSESTFEEIVGEVPTRGVEASALIGDGATLIDLLMTAELCPSKGQARKDIQGGGVYVNNVREPDFQRKITSGDLLFSRYLLLRKVKKNYALLKAS